MRLQVVGLRLEAERIISVTLRRADRKPLPSWEPGAHIALTLPSGHVRQYSLCGPQDDMHTYTVAVLEVSAGRGGSREVHERLRIGDLIEVSEPRNDFVLQQAPYYLFLAGGIGITPVLAMIESLGAAGHQDYRLIYGARNRAAMAFVDRLCAAGSGAVELRPEDDTGLVDIAAALSASPSGTRVYCCGPPAMLAAVQEVSADFPELPLHIERFAAAPRDAAGNDTAFEVELARTGSIVTVGVGETVLDAVLAVAPDTPYSCTAGFCGTCETKVISGQVEHRDDLLTDQERAANASMMICVSRSRGGTKLTLDL